MNQIAIRKTIRGLINQQIVPGITWETITENSLSGQHTGFPGNASPSARQKVSSVDPYDLVSLMKVIGATNRVLRLINTSQLAFSTTVGEILPTYQGLSCSIGELLLHQNGLPANVADKKNVTKKSLQEIILTHSLSERGKAVYSDLEYYLSEEIIQVLDRCSLEESLQTYVFQPMNLQHTSFTVSDFAQAVPTKITKQRDVIQGVVHDSKAYQLKAPIDSADLFATLPDLLTFAQCFMNNRYPSGKPLFSEKMFDALWSMNQGERTFDWGVKKARAGVDYLYHTDFTETTAGMKKETRKTLILLTNRVHPTREERDFLKARTEIYQQYFQEGMMKPKLILMSHGRVAEETLASTQIIVGELADVAIVSMTAEDGLSGTQAKLAAILKEAGNVPTLALADLEGGTPCNVAMMVMGTYPRLRVVAEPNLAMAIETAVSPVGNVDELTACLTQINQSAVTTVDLPKSTDEEEFEEQRKGIVSKATPFLRTRDILRFVFSYDKEKEQAQ